jgi:hypothetical protein
MAGRNGQSGAPASNAGTAERLAHLHESVAGVAPAAPGTKLCCVCGKDVAGHKRYKDHTGRYWCEQCKLGNLMPGAGVPCPDCHIPFPADKLVDYKDEHGEARLCDSCASKRRLAVKREHSRLAAAAEEVRRREEKKKQLTIIGAIVAALIVVGVLWWLLH